MPFGLGFGTSAALAEHNGPWLSHDECAARADRLANALTGSPRQLIVILMDNRLATTLAYLGAMRRGHVVCLLPADRDLASFATLVDVYRPDWVLAGRPAELPGYRVDDGVGERLCALRRDDSDETAMHADLGLLLSTSGSTGSPKLVRLSRRNVRANAEAIAAYMQLQPDDMAWASLPLSYSFGLSVLHSHLLAGASVVLSDLPLVQREFWTAFAAHPITTFAGVPFTYEVLRQLRFEPAAHPRLRRMLQAGGRLRDDLILHFSDRCRASGKRFFVMYGQTEATARISFLDPDRLPAKVGSVGRAIPGGALEIDGDELVYRGPNVMMGYAETRADLSRGDDLVGVLHTGDLGVCDGDGDFYLTGRRHRFAKLVGVRVSLDDVEQVLARRFGHVCACAEANELLHVFIEGSRTDADWLRAIQEAWHVHPSLVRLHELALPRTSNGKVDRAALQRIADTREAVS